jgi:hypothetical protein
MTRRRGSTLVESSIVMLLFLTILIGVLDAAQLLFFHQFLADRVRSGVRYAAVHNYSQTAIRNVVVYNTPSPTVGASGLFGLRPEMVEVGRYGMGSTADRVQVRIQGYGLRFLTPWLAGTFTAGPFCAVMPVESGGAAE